MTGTDTIRLQGIRGYGYHGVLPEERRDGQEFVVDVALSVDATRAASSDNLADTVDYSAVAGDVIALIEGEALNLIESLADRVAAVILGRNLVSQVTVTVHKPQAPVGVSVSDVSVTITRQR